MKLCHVAAFKAVDISVSRKREREREGKADMGVSGVNFCLTQYVNEKRKNLL